MLQHKHLHSTNQLLIRCVIQEGLCGLSGELAHLIMGFEFQTLYGRFLINTAYLICRRCIYH